MWCPCGTGGSGGSQSWWGDKILCPHSGLGYHIPCKAERLHAAGVELAVKDLQPFQPREGPGLYPPQLFEVAGYIGLHTLQAGLGGGKAVRRYAEGQQLCPHNAVVALGDLALQHFHILTPHFAVLVILRGNIELVLALGAAPVVDKGELERK